MGQPFFSLEPDPETVGFFGGYRLPSPSQGDPPTDSTAADGSADGDGSAEQLAAAWMAPDGLTPEQRRATYEPLLQDPNVHAFLDTVANTEGSTYDSLPGDSVKDPQKFTDYSQFPSNGPGATASGRYQILRKTYGDASRALGLSDFSLRTQDLMATYLLDRRGALEPLIRGDLDAVLPGASKEWASLPTGPGQPGRYGQHYTPYDQVRSIFDLNRSP